MIDDRIKIKCSKCSTLFGERAQRVRNGFQKQCPNCFKLITFDTSSEEANIRRALKSAREVRQAVADLAHAAGKEGAVTSSTSLRSSGVDKTSVFRPLPRPFLPYLPATNASV